LGASVSTTNTVRNRPGSVIPIKIKAKNGSIGVRVEKVPKTGGVRVVSVESGGAGEAAGLIRGDVICFGGSDGMAEITFEHFAIMVEDLCSGESGAGFLEIEVLRDAVIAAAAAREAARKKNEVKPKKSAPGPSFRGSKYETVTYDLPPPSSSQESMAAVKAAKAREEAISSSLGYNPYEVVKSGSSLAHTQAGTTPSENQKIEAKRDLPETKGNEKKGQYIINEQFDEHLGFILSHSENKSAKQSLLTMRKLILNATTKGQIEGESSEKFRRIRLANTRIAKDIVSVEGALELMMLIGFQLAEDAETKESVLVFPAGTTGPQWLEDGLNRMKNLADEL